MDDISDEVFKQAYDDAKSLYALTKQFYPNLSPHRKTRILERMAVMGLTNKFNSNHQLKNYKYPGSRRVMLKYHVLINNLLPYQCFECGINTWRGKHLVLELDHRDGNNLNNEIDNLRFLCANCHSQTETYCIGVKNEF